MYYYHNNNNHNNYYYYCSIYCLILMTADKNKNAVFFLFWSFHLKINFHLPPAWISLVTIKMIHRTLFWVWNKFWQIYVTEHDLYTSTRHRTWFVHFSVSLSHNNNNSNNIFFTVFILHLFCQSVTGSGARWHAGSYDIFFFIYDEKWHRSSVTIPLATYPPYLQ